ncbi:MAG: enoyl-CoA hydratase/isomerase family protein [Candidatus Eremiobacteraeota bacterium]|nr:enoyl-CoA hydratase/isomerase family protein [Candidatus Eremiobacteraeota bacterium]MBV8281682.1 enoyl-CoA hydratase/isomerase family protein [Candidatus Eremiobacteraeota bacterium]
MADSVTVVRDGGVARVTLNRPEKRNAFDPEMIAAVRATFDGFAKDDALRVVVIAGAGPVFCGGADIDYMQSSLAWTREQNQDDSLKLAGMMKSVNSCPVPVIARAHGAALGGGAGALAACDRVVAADDTAFGFTEVKLGIVPAVISPFVIAKIGETFARALFTTGERFDAARAMHIGLVHDVVPAAQLDSAVETLVNEVLSAGPTATRLAKEIALHVPQLSPQEAGSWTAVRLAAQRTSPEGQEGLRAFLEKRKPSWQK